MIADDYPPRQYFVLTDAGKPVFIRSALTFDLPTPPHTQLTHPYNPRRRPGPYLYLSRRRRPPPIHPVWPDPDYVHPPSATVLRRRLGMGGAGKRGELSFCIVIIAPLYVMGKEEGGAGSRSRAQADSCVKRRHAPISSICTFKS
jgi:hypothetical protein